MRRQEEWTDIVGQPSLTDQFRAEGMIPSESLEIIKTVRSLREAIGDIKAGQWFDPYTQSELADLLGEYKKGRLILGAEVYDILNGRQWLDFYDRRKDAGFSIMGYVFGAEVWTDRFLPPSNRVLGVKEAWVF